MKKRLVPLMAAVAFTLVLGSPVAAAPPCADITDGAAVITQDATSGYDITFTVTTAGRCGGASYTLTVYDSRAAFLNNEAALATQTVKGTDAGGTVTFTFENVATADATVCVVGTATLGPTVDRAPDVACTEFSGTSSGAGQFR